MKILITGGCGFLGSNLAAQAVERGDDLVVFDNLSRNGSVSNLAWLREQGEFQFVHGDIRNRSDVERLIEKSLPDAVFHLAGQVAMTASIDSPRMDFEVNALGTLNLLEAVRAFSPESIIIYSSTNKVYGDLEQYSYRETETRYECLQWPDGFDETVPLNFQSPYGCSKGAADQYLMDYSRLFGLRTIVFRHSTIYGGRQYATYDQGWIGWFCAKALERKRGVDKGPFQISGNGKQVRDILHADDLKLLYFKVLEAAGDIWGHCFNIGGGIVNSLSLLELFEILEKELDIRIDIRRLPPRASDQKVFVADTGKAAAMIGWQPGIGIEKGIKSALEWGEVAL